MSAAFYHGGIAGLNVGDVVVPAKPHTNDGCPICVARGAGRVCTVGEYRAWARRMPGGERVLKALEGADDAAPIDPPSEVKGVYMTSHLGYATHYASVRGHGDVYLVRPNGPTVPSSEDNFPTVVAASATVIRVVRRAVYLTRRERRELSREWARADLNKMRRTA